MNIQKKGFTLVELIVVVTILAILGTIGFISYNGYLLGVRDSNRTTQIDLISNGLELYRTKNPLPLPGGTSVRIEASGGLLGYQGYASQEILDLIDYSKGGKDPKDNIAYTYYVSGDRKYYQILAFLEDQANQTQSFFPSAYAADYTNRYVATAGKKLGIILDTSNTPIQESPNWTVSSEFDMAIQTNNFKMIMTDKTAITGTGGQLIQHNYRASCKRLREIGEGNKGDDVYRIDPSGDGGFDVRCDMTTDGGGWTIATMLADSTTQNLFQTANTNKITSLKDNIATAGQIGDIWRDNADKDFYIRCFVSDINGSKNYEKPFIVYGFKKADISNLTKQQKGGTLFSSVNLKAKWNNNNFILASTYFGTLNTPDILFRNSTGTLSVGGIWGTGFNTWNDGWRHPKGSLYGSNNVWINLSSSNYCISAIR